VAYGPLLRSLLSTPKDVGDSWRLVLGTLLRQAFNEGPLPSKSRITSDLRSVGWGGRRQNIARAYDVVANSFQLAPYRESQNRTDLVNFNARPPKTWQKIEQSKGPAARYLAYGVIIKLPEGSTTDSQTELYGINTGKLTTVIDALTQTSAAFNQGKERVVSGPTGVQIRDAGRAGVEPPPDITERYPETFITLEYAGVRILKR
jgi:hypothetical protein